jgi:hypothetical protein
VTYELVGTLTVKPFRCRFCPSPLNCLSQCRHRRRGVVNRTGCGQDGRAAKKRRYNPAVAKSGAYRKGASSEREHDGPGYDPCPKPKAHKLLTRAMLFDDRAQPRASHETAANLDIPAIECTS